MLFDPTKTNLLRCVAALTAAVEGNGDVYREEMQERLTHESATNDVQREANETLQRVLADDTQDELAEYLTKCMQGDAGHSFRLSLFKIVFSMPFIKQRHDIRAGLLTLMAYDISSRWALTGWVLLDLRRGGNAWREVPLTNDDFNDTNTWKELRLAVECFHEATLRTNDTTDGDEEVFGTTGLPDFCVEMWQIVSIIIAAADANGDKALLKAKRSAYKAAMKFAEEYVQLFIARNCIAVAHLYIHWLAPAMEVRRQHTRAQDCAVAENLGTLLSSGSAILNPLALLRRQCQGIKVLQPHYINIDEPDFFGKAKQLAVTGGDKVQYEYRMLQRHEKRAHRLMEKEIHKEADIINKFALIDQLRHQDKMQKERKRVAAVLDRDNTELMKMKTSGESMDTSQVAYRAKKKMKIAKGTPQK